MANLSLCLLCILHGFLSSADYFQNQFIFEKIVYGNHQSFKQFWVQAVCKSYQQKTLAYCHYLYHASFYLQMWSNVSGLLITKNDSNSSQIEIEFVMGDQKGRPFDGPGG